MYRDHPASQLNGAVNCAAGLPRTWRHAQAAVVPARSALVKAKPRTCHAQCRRSFGCMYAARQSPHYVYWASMNTTCFSRAEFCPSSFTIYCPPDQPEWSAYRCAHHPEHETRHDCKMMCPHGSRICQMLHPSTTAIRRMRCTLVAAANQPANDNDVHDSQPIDMPIDDSRSIDKPGHVCLSPSPLVHMV